MIANDYLSRDRSKEEGDDCPSIIFSLVAALDRFGFVLLTQIIVSSLFGYCPDVKTSQLFGTNTPTVIHITYGKKRARARVTASAQHT